MGRHKFVLSPEHMVLLSRIRQCEALRQQSHKRRDELILEACAKGIPHTIIAKSFGSASPSRVAQIVKSPFNGVMKNGKRRAKEDDVQESS